MARRREHHYLRAWEVGRRRWLEFVTEAAPTRAPRRIALGARIAGAGPNALNRLLVDDYGTTFRTSALSTATRILFIEELTATPAQPGADLPAWSARILDAILDGNVTGVRVVDVAQLRPARGEVKAFVDLPLTSRLRVLDALAMCVACSHSARRDTALDDGWGCTQVGTRACWYCVDCYSRLMEQQPQSMAAQAWRARQRAHRQRQQLLDAWQVLADVDAGRAGEGDALVRLAARLADRWRLTPPERAALKNRMRTDGTTERAETKRRALASALVLTVACEDPALTFPFYGRWLATDARRRAGEDLVGDAPNVRRVSLDEVGDLRDPGADPLHDLLVPANGDERETDVDRLPELLEALSPEQRRILRKALDTDVPLMAAARALQMTPNTASRQVGRIRSTARAILQKHA